MHGNGETQHDNSQEMHPKFLLYTMIHHRSTSDVRSISDEDVQPGHDLDTSHREQEIDHMCRVMITVLEVSRHVLLI